MSRFATYIHPQTFETTKPVDNVQFVGQSYPHYKHINETLLRAIGDQYPNLPLRKANWQDFERVHNPEYLKLLEQLSKDEPVEKMPRLSGECYAMWYCLPGYCYGLGGLFEAIDRMKTGTLERAYCFSSSGGHHAYADWGHGYCIVNAPAVATRYAQEHSFKNVVMLDWDIHHGDGTQSIFANDPNVYCISSHNATELYMVMQKVSRDGLTDAGEKVGHCNIPLLQTRFEQELWDKMNFTGKYYRAHEAKSELKNALDNVPI